MGFFNSIDSQKSLISEVDLQQLNQSPDQKGSIILEPLPNLKDYSSIEMAVQKKN